MPSAGLIFSVIPLQLWLALAVVVLGLFVYGFSDLRRLSPSRVWAISSVCFAESIRRRVLWIAPLAMIGVMFVSQLQRPLDEQDAVRQTIKFSLFAAGMVVTLTAIILACTNLPRDIETRVIFTIVTKPTTRLEIVLGKIVGFAKVSAATLLIMGLFAFAYLHLQAWGLQRDVRQRLSSGAVDPISRPTFEYWVNHGLLSSRSFARPTNLQVLAREPAAGDTKRRFFGSLGGDMIVPFEVSPEELTPAGIPGATPGSGGLVIRLMLGFDRSEFGEASAVSDLPVGIAAATEAPTTQSQGPPRTADVSLEILDENLQTIIPPSSINNGRPITLNDPTGQTEVRVGIQPDVCQNLVNVPVFYVSVLGVSRGAEFIVDAQTSANPLGNPVSLLVPGTTRQTTRAIGPMHDRTGPQNQYSPTAPAFRGRGNFVGHQLRGGEPRKSPVAIYSFRNAVPSGGGQTVAFEMRMGIELGGEGEESDATRLQLNIVDPLTQTITGSTLIYPENNRMCYFNIPADAVKSGNFDFHIRNLSEGHFSSIVQNSLAMVVSIESFNLNLLKSLSILWMLSILVVIISIFCSTFLSWPIAVVLTFLILLGHWGVVQLGDALAPGIGPRVATDLFGGGAGNASKAKVVSSTVEALSRMLTELGAILPDIGEFSAIEDIERGITIPREKLLSPILVLLIFGLPMIVVSYVILRNKEVAP